MELGLGIFAQVLTENHVFWIIDNNIILIHNAQMSETILENREEIKTVSTTLSISDRVGGFLVRWAFMRNNYKVEPGIYKVGVPNEQSSVFVTANYKLTFDFLRAALHGFSAWILVLDTKGVNVWCAAGKGTFGTKELVSKIETTKLSEIVAHRQLILPQLSATGIAAHEVQKNTGFKVLYGPVSTSDIPAFIKNNFAVSASMRIVKFTLWDRLVLVPIELVHAFLPILLIAGILILIAGIHPTGYSLALAESLQILFGVFMAYLAGALFTPLLLPWVPYRSFSMKGFVVGLVVAIVYVSSYKLSIFNALVWTLLITSVSSFLAMNFTGSSTYTSLSGVKKEMKVAIPLQLVAFILGLIIFIVSSWI